MTPNEQIILRELQAARGTSIRGVSLTGKTVTALTGLSKDDTEAALESLTTSGHVAKTSRSGVARYAAL